jgi:hypothetical protein
LAEEIIKLLTKIIKTTQANIEKEAAESKSKPTN